MDLFAGCGGISLGFLTAGFSPVSFVEIDEWAAASHRTNIADSNSALAGQHHVARDITTEDPETIFADLELTGAVDQQIDVLVGGPPCQAFARVGRAKLREQAYRRAEETADFAFLVDGRVSLWRRYVEYVRATRPIALLMENVPDILNHGHINVAELIARSLSDEGYEVRYTLLNASWYGTPQTRERMILVGYHRETGLIPQFPVPTHHVVLPRGYEGTKNTARKVLIRHGSDHHVYISDPSPTLPAATTAREALADLPSIYALNLFQKGHLKRGRKDPAEPCIYTSQEPTTKWSRLMRHWDGFGTTDHTTGHVIRFLPRDYKIFAELENGWEYPEIWQHVENKISAWLQDRSRRGLSTDYRNPDVKDFMESWRIPYDKDKFPNKWWVLEAEKPVRTLLAHLGKDSYSHIHFDPAQARTISIREAARLQGFPDGFKFCGSMNPAFKQIGNAVPPLFAYALAVAMKSTIGAPVDDDIRVRLLELEQSLIQITEGTT
ncbi:DNA cytosine methyltransferase [Geobacter sp. FeAm09]|uniref:DNA cytosine methyltransferase n=1 Tax=Geobacter sp. FeAm09 TaxID=2597769 RepID=UPI0011EDF1BD|nr:DNA (cytosine-5-)-methyltransferase [Geobacter sp. FeAm09]QEM67410.1 DNA cytosine methyltransferase [Geobacter sp. FeAm09]